MELTAFKPDKIIKAWWEPCDFHSDLSEIDSVDGDEKLKEEVARRPLGSAIMLARQSWTSERWTLNAFWSFWNSPSRE